MKAMMKTLAVVIAAASVQAFADFGTQTKPRMSSDMFNKMIESNNNTRNELKKDIDGKTAAPDDGKLLPVADAERNEVIDFVDVEVGFDPENHHPIVSSPNGRKYQSVDAPVIYNAQRSAD